MEQNTIAMIWDFDKTLIDGYMQSPLFKKFDINENHFWKEVNELPGKYNEQNVRVNKDTIYLNHMLTCVKQGLFPNLNNKLLYELGKELVFYNGIPDVFKALKDIIEQTSEYKKFGIHVEHYIVSTGLTQIIKGSTIAQYIDGIWGCEFIESPILSKLAKAEEVKSQDSYINQIAYAIDNTSKTRAIFEINKGSNIFDYIDVNSKMDNKDRRVPFENMIYIADGPSDVPVFSVIKQYGGTTFAIYPKGDEKALEQVDSLQRDGRIDAYAIANYSVGEQAFMWLKSRTKKIAQRIYEKAEERIKKSAALPPKHLSE